MEATGELLADSYEASVHPEDTLPQGITDESDLAKEAWSKEKNSIWDNDE